MYIKFTYYVFFTCNVLSTNYCSYCTLNKYTLLFILTMYHKYTLWNQIQFLKYIKFTNYVFLYNVMYEVQITVNIVLFNMILCIRSTYFLVHIIYRISSIQRYTTRYLNVIKHLASDFSSSLMKKVSLLPVVDTLDLFNLKLVQSRDYVWMETW